MGAVGRRRRSPAFAAVVALGIAVVLPFFLGTIDMARVHVMLALIVIFTSIVCITGFCGYITLGQAGFAGFGAYMTGRMVLSAHLPVLLAMLVGGFAAMLLGLVAGYPALKRRGLFLGLTTLSVGLLAYRAVFTSDVFKTRGLQVPRPGLFGWSLSGDYPFYFFELVCVVLVLALAHNLRSGRLGRILAAMRDSEVAAQSIGIELRTYKLFIFAASAFIAGIGGSLLAQQAQIFSGDSFDPITSFLWFTVVMVAGVASLWGAVTAGVVFVLLDVILHANGASQLVIGAGALLIGYIPGHSLVGLFSRIGNGLLQPRRLQKAFSEARAANGTSPGASALAAANGANGSSPATVGADLEPTPYAERVLREARS
jgi:branched-chain amino acid transport system permease protein